MKVVCVSGTPGTGKTTLSKKLSQKLDYRYLDANKIISKYHISEGYDKKRKTKIIDVQKLNKALIKEIDSIKTFSNKSIKNKKTNGIIIDSHLSHYLPKKYVDLCIITKCNIKELNKRLKKKKFHKDKIKENLQSEIFDVCLNEASQAKHKILVIESSKSFNISNIASKMGG